MKQTILNEESIKTITARCDDARRRYATIADKISSISSDPGFSDAREALDATIELISGTDILERTGFIIKRSPSYSLIAERYNHSLEQLNECVNKIDNARIELARNAELIKRCSEKLGKLLADVRADRKKLSVDGTRIDSTVGRITENENVNVIRINGNTNISGTELIEKKCLTDFELLTVLIQQGIAQCTLFTVSISDMIDRLDSIEKNSIPAWKQQASIALGIAERDAAISRDADTARALTELSEKNATALGATVEKEHNARHSEAGTIDEKALNEANMRLVNALDAVHDDLGIVARDVKQNVCS